MKTSTMSEGEVAVERRLVPRDRDISVVVPVYNEELNVDDVYVRLAEVLTSNDVEFIFVDDGSTDHTAERLRAIATLDNRVKVIQLRRNYGQTAALSAGIDYARGRIIVPMDGDMQNDPRDIPRLMAKLDE